MPLPIYHTMTGPFEIVALSIHAAEYPKPFKISHLRHLVSSRQEIYCIFSATAESCIITIYTLCAYLLASSPPASPTPRMNEKTTVSRHL